MQPTVEEASDTCTQECLILGHSDSCWMPAALTNPSPSQIKTSAICHSPPRTRSSARRYSPPVTQTVAICHSPPVTQAIALCHSPPPAQASAVCYSPTLVQAVVVHHSPPLPEFATLHHVQAQPPMGLQQEWVQGAGADGLYPIDEGVQGGTRDQFYTITEIVHPDDDDSVKVIPLTTFTSGQQARSSRGDSPIIEEHPL